MRPLFEIILPLALPTAIYFAYILLLRPRGGGDLPDIPWPWLGSASVLLLGITFLALALLGGADPSAHYQPPKVVDGKIEPGHFEPQP